RNRICGNAQPPRSRKIRRRFLVQIFSAPEYACRVHGRRHSRRRKKPSPRRVDGAAAKTSNRGKRKIAWTEIRSARGREVAERESMERPYVVPPRCECLLRASGFARTLHNRRGEERHAELLDRRARRLGTTLGIAEMAAEW